jgi:hypothetical protein
VAVGCSSGGAVLIVAVGVGVVYIAGVIGIAGVVSFGGGVGRVYYESAAEVAAGRKDPTFISISGRRLRSGVI